MKQKLKQTKSMKDSIQALCPLSSPHPNLCPRIQLLSTNYKPPHNNNSKTENRKETKVKISIKMQCVNINNENAPPQSNQWSSYREHQLLTPTTDQGGNTQMFPSNPSGINTHQNFPQGSPHKLMVSTLYRHRISLTNKEILVRYQDIMPRITTRDHMESIFKTVFGTGPTP
jgi:hypothetical protein